MSITFFIPKRFMKKGMSKIQQVSLICDNEISMLAWFTPKVSAYSGMLSKLVIKGLAKPLVICKLTPSSMEKKKKMAIFFCLNSEKARNPSWSAMLLRSVPLEVGHVGNVKLYKKRMMLNIPDTTNWFWLGWNPIKSTNHMVQINPIVPKTRIGGKSFTVSMPAWFSPV